MGELIEFPKRPDVRTDVAVEVKPAPETCSEFIHVFDSVPGACKCGDHTWWSLPRPDFIGIHEVTP